ncbi:MAG: hypothetical protein U9Q04_06065 [Campylobacterota bacterium]|nr:hypothetical protein [Campylobacterota bacterium]
MIKILIRILWFLFGIMCGILLMSDPDRASAIANTTHSAWDAISNFIYDIIDKIN